MLKQDGCHYKKKSMQKKTLQSHILKTKWLPKSGKENKTRTNLPDINAVMTDSERSVDMQTNLQDQYEKA